MPCHRLQNEAYRSLTRVTPRIRPGALFSAGRQYTQHRSGSAAPAHERRFVYQTQYRPCRNLSSTARPSAEPARQQPLDEWLVESRAANTEFRDSDVQHDGLPSLEQLQELEATLLNEFEDELRQAADEEGLELDTDIEEADNEPTNAPRNELSFIPGESAVDTVLAQGTFESIEDAHGAVLNALKNDSAPQELLFTFFRAAQHPEYLNSLSVTEVEEIIAAIQPEQVLSAYRQISRELHPSALRHYRSRTFESIHAVYSEVVELLLVQIEYSKQTPRHWLLKILLNIARVCGDDLQARKVFQKLKAVPDYQPELEPFNHFLEALCWAGAYTSERFQLRVTPTSLALRDTSNTKDEVALKYRRFKYRTGPGGLREEVLKGFKEMQEAGLAPDATSYKHLMIAMAREGVMGDVKWILKNVWDVDCSRILKGDEGDLLLENRLQPDSRLFPDQETIFAIVHSFAINGDIPTAIKVVDFFSRKYELSISTRSWTEILEWAYVQSSPITGRGVKERRSSKRRELPATSVLDIWRIMSSPPYNVKATMPILEYLIGTCARRDARAEQIRFMLRAARIAGGSRRRAAEMMEQGVSNTVVEHVVHYEQLRDFTAMQKFLRLLLRTSNGKRMRSNKPTIQHEWHFRTVPDVIARFWRYRLPKGNAYSIPSGRIQFHPGASPGLLVQPLATSKRGVTLLRTTQPDEIETQVGYSRQLRLQQRHQRRENLFGRAPRWTPMWHEDSSVTNWDPLSKRPTSRPSSEWDAQIGEIQ